MSLQKFINETQERFSLRFEALLKFKKISIPEFGKLYNPEKSRSTIGYYFLNSPNVTIYSIAKVCVILNIDINYFVVEEVENIDSYKRLNQNVEKIWNDALSLLGKNIKTHRKSNEQVLLDLDVITNIDSSDLSKIERAKKNITLKTFSTIAFNFHLKLDDLFKK